MDTYKLLAIYHKFNALRRGADYFGIFVLWVTGRQGLASIYPFRLSTGNLNASHVKNITFKSLRMDTI